MYYSVYSNYVHVYYNVRTSLYLVHYIAVLFLNFSIELVLLTMENPPETTHVTWCLERVINLGPF